LKDKLAITISDLNGSKTYLVSYIIKKFAAYFAIFVFIMIAGGAFYIYRISNTTELLRSVRDGLKVERKTLSEENAKYSEELKILDEKIKVSTAKYEAIEDKIARMEEDLGLNPDAKIEILDRIENYKLSALEKQAMFTQIPNGRVIAEYKRISSRFGWRDHPIDGTRIFHHGVDFACEVNTPIFAPAGGIVEFAGFNGGGYGYLVTINHNFGFKTRYAHMTGNLKVKNGQFVQRGDVIGYCGNTGRSTGPHLHYEVMFLSRHLEPLNFVNWDVNNYESIFTKETNVAWGSLLRSVTATIHKID